MERKLYDAAREGSITSLQNLLAQDPILLDRIPTLGIYAETPLHIACLLGNLDFVKELLQRKPSYASELDLYKSTPLHITAATNNIEIVTHLVHFSPSSCLALDIYGRLPVHIAAIRGRIDVLKKLLQVNPAAAREIAHQGDGILHLCVRYYQFEALKVLLQEISDFQFVNSVDCDGNTVLHLAVLDKQSEVVSYLLQNTAIEVNAKNGNNQTALDILFMDAGGIIGRNLQNAGALISNISPNNPSRQISQHHKKENLVFRYLEQKQEAVMIAASLIAAAAFQVGVTPPGGVYQDTVKDNAIVLHDHEAGSSIMAYSNPSLYMAFIVQNTVGFLAALFVFLLLLTGLPQKYRFFKGVITMAIWMAIVAIATSYFSSIITVAPPQEQQKVISFAYTVLIVTITFWVSIILWYAGLGPRLKKIFRLLSLENQPIPTRSASVLGGTVSGNGVV